METSVVQIIQKLTTPLCMFTNLRKRHIGRSRSNPYFSTITNFSPLQQNFMGTSKFAEIVNENLRCSDAPSRTHFDMEITLVALQWATGESQGPQDLKIRRRVPSITMSVKPLLNHRKHPPVGSTFESLFASKEANKKVSYSLRLSSRRTIGW